MSPEDILISAPQTPCECAAAGYCARHKCEKRQHYHQLCRTRIDYFFGWETGVCPCDDRPLNLQCVHRGEQIGWAECSGCGEKRVRLKVFACALHAQCVIARSTPAVRGCAECPDRALESNA